MRGGAIPLMIARVSPFVTYLVEVRAGVEGCGAEGTLSDSGVECSLKVLNFFGQSLIFFWGSMSSFHSGVFRSCVAADLTHSASVLESLPCFLARRFSITMVPYCSSHWKNKRICLSTTKGGCGGVGDKEMRGLCNSHLRVDWPLPISLGTVSRLVAILVANLSFASCGSKLNNNPLYCTQIG